MNRALIRNLAYNFSKPFPFSLLRRLSGQNFIFPFYHLVSDDPSPLIKHLYPVLSEKQFQNDLDFLLKHFSPASFDEVLTYAQNKSYSGKPKFYLSFDDGFSECSGIVAPVLKKRGIPAAFFVNPAFVGNHQLSHRQKVSLVIDRVIQNDNVDLRRRLAGILKKEIQNKQDLIKYIKKLTIADSDAIDNIAQVYEVDFDEALHQYKPYMSILQIRQLIDDGFEVGSHSQNHPEFRLLKEGEMKKQLTASFQFLEKELEIRKRIFSFPFNDIGVPLSFFNFLQDEMNLQVSFGTSGIKHDNAPGHLQRVPMELIDLAGAGAIIRSEYFYYLGKSLAGKNSIKRG